MKANIRASFTEVVGELWTKIAKLIISSNTCEIHEVRLHQEFGSLNAKYKKGLEKGISREIESPDVCQITNPADLVIH